ncbi:condensin subunit Smc [human gut metagenome]|uniref:Condensin subunit Smc n=1 Tax=human gut metagenome TaxID=408170 RepID=K1SYX3_9ZZZZ
MDPLKRDSEKAEQFLAYSETRKGLEITLWVDSIRRAQDTVRDQQRKYEAAESDYARISRQLDEFDTRTEALRAEAQQLMLQVEEANAEIRTITEQNAGSEKPAGSFAERNRTRERADPQRQR